jgi:hypothetical protein
MKCAKELTPYIADELAAQKIVSRCSVDGECLTWSGATSKPDGKGYGRIRLSDGGNHCTHRVMWTHHNGALPKGKIICHKCDNPLCCNSDHMFISDQYGNMRDMRLKGRMANHKDFVSRGEDSVKAKMTEKDVEFLILNYKPFDKEFGGTAMTKRFGIQGAQIVRISKGLRWAHVYERLQREGKI